MSQEWVIILRALCGGLLVTVFALIGEMVSPKRFAGIFAAGPAVALAGMTVTWAFLGSRAVAESALGMIVGAVALVAFCATAAPLVERLGAIAGSVVAMAVWAAVAAIGWLLIR
ncbi:DUF3147 family protein [Sphaerisporangium album]|uniref:DUF3147 family protein n=1 Tax=Sphaerisporangium album TaxID=509200 RepID=A0A367FRX4_9ACTN|nr:DUF3147 family protein [Sphaerisporangium album]RCG33138.1 DUF3147 family protein [Sphaerisporangium album]